MNSIVHLFRQGNTVAMSIPRPFRHALQLDIGSELRLEIVNGRLIVTPLELAIREKLARAGLLPDKSSSGVG